MIGRDMEVMPSVADDVTTSAVPASANRLG